MTPLRETVAATDAPTVRRATSRCLAVLLVLAGCAQPKGDGPVRVEWADPEPRVPAPARRPPGEDAAAGPSDTAAPARPPKVRRTPGGSSAPDARAPDPVGAPTAPAATGPVETRPQVLVRGGGPVPNPPPEPVAGHTMLPVWDDALGPRPQAASLVWGASELVLNLYEPPRATPMQIEFSLDGGPWFPARYGRVVVPDLGVGSYQVRCVAWPARGESRAMEPVLLERTVRGWHRK